MRKQPLVGPAAEPAAAQALGELFGLWFGREALRGRPPSDMVYSGMLVQAMNDGRLTFDEAMALHPAVPRGAQVGARGANRFSRKLRFPKWRPSAYYKAPDLTPEVQLLERIRREIGTIEVWFAGLDKPKLGRPPTTKDLDIFIYRVLAKHFHP